MQEHPHLRPVRHHCLRVQSSFWGKEVIDLNVHAGATAQWASEADFDLLAANAAERCAFQNDYLVILLFDDVNRPHANTKIHDSPAHWYNEVEACSSWNGRSSARDSARLIPPFLRVSQLRNKDKPHNQTNIYDLGELSRHHRHEPHWRLPVKNGDPKKADIAS